jgi:ADP-L-glycero-D-manno-heptose 6-epimerase
MIVLTGGAGMIGSVIAWHLETQCARDDIVIVDHILQADQWQNLVHRRMADYLDRDELFPWLEQTRATIDAVIHMGAISNTTERDFNVLLEHNIRYSQRLWQWCAAKAVPFLYASSAATYGGGEHGYIDGPSIDALRPLNGYGFSKQFFDQWVLRQLRVGAPCPPQWVGFKFFNVYGPNEYHKERMASVAFHTFNQVRAAGSMHLFRSHHPDYADGMQMRDFVSVKDAADIVAFFLEHREQSGVFNVGTGQARAFRDLAWAVMDGMGVERRIEYIDMPEDLRGKYQYFTQADVNSLRRAGYCRPFTPLEEGVADYVRNHLMHTDPYC